MFLKRTTNVIALAAEAARAPFLQSKEAGTSPARAHFFTVRATRAAQ